MPKMNYRLRPAWLVVGAIALIWTFVVVAGYYVVHKPFRPDNAMALLRTGLDVATWLFTLVAATGLGWRVARRWLSAVAPLEGLALSCGLGLGILSLLTLALGLAGGLKPWLMWLLVVVVAVVGARPLRDLLQRLKASGLPRADTRFERLLLIYLLLALLPPFLAALAPPIAWDSQLYHLTGPKLYIEAGRIRGGIDIPELAFPAVVDMLFTAAMLLKGTAVAKLLHFTYALLSFLSIYVLAQRYLSRRAGLLGMAVLASAPSILLVASWAYVDVALLFYELAAFQLLMRWFDVQASKIEGQSRGTSERGTLLLMGAFCGLAMGIKYTAALLPITLVTIILFSSRRAGWRLATRRVLLVSAGTILVAAPWFLRNWAFTGNPVYPFLFPGRYWDSFRSWFFSRPGTGLASTAPWRLLIAPWEATIYGQEGAVGYSATIGPLFLLAIPFLFLTWRKWSRLQRKSVRLLVIVCIPQYLFWLYGVAQSVQVHQTRLLFPIFGLLALLAGFALDRLEVLDTPQFSLARFFSAVILLVLGFDLLSAGLRFARGNPLPYLAGQQSAQEYVRQYQAHYQEAMEYINEELPLSAKIYFLWEPRSFYCEREVWPDAVLDGFLHLRYRFDDAAGINDYLHGQGYTHVLLYQQGLDYILEAQFDPVTPEDLAVLQELQARYWAKIQEWGEAYVLYELVP